MQASQQTKPEPATKPATEPAKRAHHAARAASLWLALLLPAIASANSANTPPAWLAQANAYLQSKADAQFPNHHAIATLKRLDPRLRLRDCDGPAFNTPGSGRSTGGRLSVQVQCDAPTAWTVYLPAEIRLQGEVAVLSRSVRRGEPVTEQDVSWQQQDVTAIPDALSRVIDEQPLVGLVGRRNLPAGTVLRPSMLERPLAVRRGERVTIVSSRPGLSIESVGEALADARVGEPIRIRNAGSRRLIQAWAVASGLVSTAPPQQLPASAKVSTRSGR